MDDRNAQVGWSEAQWNRVREEVLRAWQSVRVAGSFLPVFGALPRATQVVPSEVFLPNGTIDERSVSPLVEISLPVLLSRQQVMEEGLSGALLQFRRRASQLGQLEDWYIFNGTYPRGGDRIQTPLVGAARLPNPPRDYLPSSPFLNPLVGSWPIVRGAPEPVVDRRTMIRGLLLRDPGTLGLILGARTPQRAIAGPAIPPPRGPLTRRGLMNVIVDAMNALEGNGYTAPYACVFGRLPFQRAHDPVGGSTTYLRDRIEPLIGRELLHASALDVPPRQFGQYHWPFVDRWQSRGVLVSLSGEAVDLAIAAEATPEFRQVDVNGRYVFSVFERFTLRIKDPQGMVPLRFY